MTIEEAIRHAKVTAKLKYNEATMHRSNLDNEQCNNCVECAKEHEQLPMPMSAPFCLSL